VYATSRKQAELLAKSCLARLRGQRLPGEEFPRLRTTLGWTRHTEQCRRRFRLVSWKCVATIAFGMGSTRRIFERDSRGAAGNTGRLLPGDWARRARWAMSRTYLMHSYADQRTHDFFLNRDYPPWSICSRSSRRWRGAAAVEELRIQCKLGDEEFDKALEKLEIHGGARMDFGGNATVGGPGWKKTYTVRRSIARSSLRRCCALPPRTNAGWRRWFALRRCGGCEPTLRVCDVCDPGGQCCGCFAGNADGAEMVQAIADDLRPVDYKATGPCNGVLNWWAG